MSRILLESSLPDSPKFIDGPELAFSLHVKALLYAARALTDGFIPRSKAYTLVNASRRQVDKALSHLSSVQPGCANPSWETHADGWQIHDYGDPEYMNPMRAEHQELTQKRRIAAQKGGLMSVKKRMEKYGSAQPVKTGSVDGAANSAPEANVEPTSEARASWTAEPHASGFGSTGTEQLPKQTSKHPSRSQPNLPSPPSVTSSPDIEPGEKDLSVESGDDAVLVGANGSGPPHPWANASKAALVGKVMDWFCLWRGWDKVQPDTHATLEADAKAMVALGIPGRELHAILELVATRPDRDEVNGLAYFHGPVQDEAHSRVKQQGRSHGRVEGLTKLDVGSVL